MPFSCSEGISQEVKRAKPQNQSELSSESVSVVTSQAVAGRVFLALPGPTDLLLPAGWQWPRAGQQWPGHQLFPPAWHEHCGRVGPRDGRMSETAL